MRPRSPIEQMVYRACGFVPGADLGPKDPVTLLCTECRATLVVEREPDFFDFTTIETTCPKCRRTERHSNDHEGT